MKIMILFYIIFCFINVLLCYDSQMVVEEVSNFPLNIEDFFKIKFSGRKQYPPFTVMCFEIYDKSGINRLDKLSIDPGIYDKIPNNNIVNKYIQIKDWYKDDYKRLTITLKFLKSSYDKFFKIRFIEAETKKERDGFLEDMEEIHVVFKHMLDLYINPVLDFTIKTLDERQDGVNHGQIAIVMCQSKDGKPPSQPTVTFSSSITQKSSQSDPENLSQRIEIIPNLKDHGELVECQAGNTKQSLKINVFHHPSKLVLSPNYTGYLPNGTSVLCQAVDGYPQPKSIQWIFIWSSITNYTDKYYQITGNNLKFLHHAPKSSLWRFNCSAENSIPNSLKRGVIITYQFEVSPIPLLSKTIIISLIVLAVFIIIIIVAFILHKKGYLKKIKKKPKKTAHTIEEIQINNNELQSIYTFSPCTPDNTQVDDSVKNDRKKPKAKPRKPRGSPNDNDAENTMII